MTKLVSTLILSLLIVSCVQNKQTLNKDKERIDNVCNQFMQAFAAGKTSESLALLKENSVIDHSTIDSLQAKINTQVNTLFTAYGKILSSEFIIERKVKGFIAKRFYILKFDNYYLKFSFTLYNNGKNWTITNFEYNEDLIEVLY